MIRELHCITLDWLACFYYVLLKIINTCFYQTTIISWYCIFTNIMSVMLDFKVIITFEWVLIQVIQVKSNQIKWKLFYFLREIMIITFMTSFFAVKLMEGVCMVKIDRITFFEYAPVWASSSTIAYTITIVITITIAIAITITITTNQQVHSIYITAIDVFILFEIRLTPTYNNHNHDVIVSVCRSACTTVNRWTIERRATIT